MIETPTEIFFKVLVKMKDLLQTISAQIAEQTDLLKSVKGTIEEINHRLYEQD